MHCFNLVHAVIFAVNVKSIFETCTLWKNDGNQSDLEYFGEGGMIIASCIIQVDVPNPAYSSSPQNLCTNSPQMVTSDTQQCHSISCLTHTAGRSLSWPAKYMYPVCLSAVILYNHQHLTSSLLSASAVHTVSNHSMLLNLAEIVFVLFVSFLLFIFVCREKYNLKKTVWFGLLIYCLPK